MKTHVETMTETKVNQRINLKVYASEERAGFFIIHPVGDINTSTYPILQKEMESIYESSPEIILFDMKQANYVNFRGLRVLLKTILEMNQRKGKVRLTNLQPHVKVMLEIMVDALPDWIYESQKPFETFLDATKKKCAGNGQWTKLDNF